MIQTEKEMLAQQFIQTIAEAMHTPVLRNTMAITRGEIGALLCLYQHPDGLSSGKMGELMGISSGGVANLLKTLEAKRLLKRSFSEKDRRCVLVEITPEGTAVAEAKYKQLEKEVVGMIDAVGEEKVRGLLDIGVQVFGTAKEEE